MTVTSLSRDWIYGLWRIFNGNKGSEGKQRYAWSSVHPRGAKMKGLWLEIKEGRNESNVKAGYYGLLLSAWWPGRSQIPYRETSKPVYWMETSFTQMLSVWKLPDLFYWQLHLPESRGEKTVAVMNLVWELLGKVKMRKHSPRKGTVVIGGWAHRVWKAVLWNLGWDTYISCLSLQRWWQLQ